MNCPNCKNPINENANQCEWCNYALISSNHLNIKSVIQDKGECLFFSKRVKQIHGFYEVHEQFIKIISRDEKLHLIINRENIYNIEPYSRLKWIHLIPIIGTIVRYFILLFSKYERGYSIITSKSGDNFIIPKKINLKTFDVIAKNYMQDENRNAKKKHINDNTGSGSFIDKNGIFTAGGNTYMANLIEKHSDIINTDSVDDFEKQCPNCSIWIFHEFYGKHNCPKCNQEYFFNNLI